MGKCHFNLLLEQNQNYYKKNWIRKTWNLIKRKRNISINYRKSFILYNRKSNLMKFLKNKKNIFYLNEYKIKRLKIKMKLNLYGSNNKNNK